MTLGLGLGERMSSFRHAFAKGAGPDVRWGVVDQLCSSATNFVLALLVGRWLGPDDLGVAAVGFSAYLLVLGLQRALVTDPLIVSTAHVAPADDRGGTSASLTMVIVFSSLGAIGIAAVGLGLGGTIGRGLVLFAPWMVPALVQDAWRFILFRDRRGRSAALNDGAWVVGMAVMLPFARAIDGLWPIVAAWGVGAAVGAVLGFGQTRSFPAKASAAYEWWKQHAWELGRWLMLESVVFAVGSQTVIFILAGLLGTSDVGGFRASMALFAPMTLLGPALALPGLPAIARALDGSLEAARRRAALLGVVAGLGSVCYVVAVGVGGGSLLAFVFGPPFARFRSLIAPIAFVQVISGSVTGFYLLLKALRLGKTMVLIGITTGLASIMGAAVGALVGGIVGAAWGLTGAGALGAAVTLAAAFRARPLERPTDPPRRDDIPGGDNAAAAGLARRSLRGA